MLVTREGYRCHECTDQTKDARGCPYARTERETIGDIGEPTCPVLDVPGWYWHGLRTIRRTEAGLIPPRDRAYDEVLRLEAYGPALDRGRRADEQWQQIQSQNAQADSWRARWQAEESR